MFTKSENATAFEGKNRGQAFTFNNKVSSSNNNFSFANQNSMNILKIILFYFISCLFNQTIAQQPFTLDKNIKPIELKLNKFQPKNKPNAWGKMGILKAYQVKDTVYYYCKGLSIYSVANIVVSLKEKQTPITVSLHKNSWNQALRTKKTDKEGIFKEQFKTEGGFSIRVIVPKKPVNYNIIVWVSDEIKLKLQAPFKKK